MKTEKRFAAAARVDSIRQVLLGSKGPSFALYGLKQLKIKQKVTFAINAALLLLLL
jgi:hypothetical protein